MHEAEFLLKSVSLVLLEHQQDVMYGVCDAFRWAKEGRKKRYDVGGKHLSVQRCAEQDLTLKEKRAGRGKDFVYSFCVFFVVCLGFLSLFFSYFYRFLFFSPVSSLFYNHGNCYKLQVYFSSYLLWQRPISTTDVSNQWIPKHTSLCKYLFISQCRKGICHEPLLQSWVATFVSACCGLCHLLLGTSDSWVLVWSLCFVWVSLQANIKELCLYSKHKQESLACMLN